MDPSGQVLVEVLNQFVSTPLGQRVISWISTQLSLSWAASVTWLSENWAALETIIYSVGQYGGEIQNESRSSGLTLSQKPSDNIDWGRDKNGGGHILRGSKKSKDAHGPIWRRFNIDPDNNNDWGALLPILKRVVDEGRQQHIEPACNKYGKVVGTLIYYTKDFMKEGVRVFVRIFVDDQGRASLSDAWGSFLN